MDAIELQNRLKNFTHRMVSLCESIPLTDKCRVFEHQLLSFAYALETPVQTFPRNLKPLPFSLSIALDELHQALRLLDVMADRELLCISKVLEIKSQGDALTLMFPARWIKTQTTNRNY